MQANMNLFRALCTNRMNIAQNLIEVSQKLLGLSSEANVSQLLDCLTERQGIVTQLIDTHEQLNRVGEETFGSGYELAQVKQTFGVEEQQELENAMAVTSEILAKLKELDPQIASNLERHKQNFADELLKLQNKKRLTHSFQNMPRLDAKFLDKKV